MCVPIPTPSVDITATMRRITTMRQYGCTVQDIHDRLVESGLSEEMAYLCYVAETVASRPIQGSIK